MSTGGGGGGGSTTTVQKSDPWSGQQPYLSQVFQNAQDLYQNPSDYPQYYQNSTVSPFNDMQSNSINSLYNYGQNGGSGALQSADKSLQGTLNGDYLSQGNPYQAQLNQNILASVVPGLTAQFTQGNNMNNPAAAYAVSQGATNALANSEYGNYQQERQNQLSASYQAPVESNAVQSALQGGYNAGSAQQQQSQNELTDQVNRYNYNQNLPYQMLNTYDNFINGTYGGTTSQTQPYYSNGLANTLSTASSLGTLGYLGYMALSDRRVKKNIKRIGKLKNGIGAYEFDYIWGGPRCIGVMADEVERIIPDAVITGRDGIKMVNYALLGD